MKVIVIGGNHHNTLGVIRSLGRKGINPDVILTSVGNSFVAKSKYIDHCYQVKGSEAAIDKLMDYAEFETKKLVIACHDEISSYLDLNMERLIPYFIIPSAYKQGRVTEFMNKMRMAEMAISSGFQVPKTGVFNYTSFQQQLDFPFPCITKPIESIKGKKDQIQRYNNKESLLWFLEKEKRKNFLIQQFIIKELEFQLIGCSLNYGEQIIIPGVSKIIRQPSNTNTGFLQYTTCDKSYETTIANTKLFIRNIGYSGLFSVEFIRDKRGLDYFMEINFRNDGNAISVTNAGVNLPYIWYLAAIGADFNTEIKDIHDEFVMPEFAELNLYTRGLISNRQWRKDMKKATSFMDYDPDDPNPTCGWQCYKKMKRLAWVKHIIHTIIK